MKPNIDLTLNRDFQDRSVKSIKSFKPRAMPSIRNLIRPNKKTMPWEWDTYKREQDELVWTGNRSEIRKKKKWESRVNNEICERCGKDNLRIPWDRDYGLCKACSRQMESELSREPILSILS